MCLSYFMDKQVHPEALTAAPFFLIGLNKLTSKRLAGLCPSSPVPAAHFSTTAGKDKVLPTQAHCLHHGCSTFTNVLPLKPPNPLIWPPSHLHQYRFLRLFKTFSSQAEFQLCPFLSVASIYCFWITIMCDDCLHLIVHLQTAPIWGSLCTFISYYSHGSFLGWREGSRPSFSV